MQNCRGKDLFKGSLRFAGDFGRRREFFFTDSNRRFESGASHSIAAGAAMPGMMIRALLEENSQAESMPIRDDSMM